MGVPRAGHRDAGREVEEAVAVDIGHGHAVGRLGDQRVGAREAGTGHGLVALDEGSSPRARQLGLDARRRIAGSRGGCGLDAHRVPTPKRSGASCPRPWLDRPGMVSEAIRPSPPRPRRSGPARGRRGRSTAAPGRRRPIGVRHVRSGADAARGDDHARAGHQRTSVRHGLQHPIAQRPPGEAPGLGPLRGCQPVAVDRGVAQDQALRVLGPRPRSAPSKASGSRSGASLTSSGRSAVRVRRTRAGRSAARAADPAAAGRAGRACSAS